MVLRELYEAHFRFVWRCLRRLGVPSSDVADAAQEVFLVVHRRLGEFEGRAKVTTWLFRICLNVARDRRRLAHVRREVLQDTALLDEYPARRLDEARDLALLDDLLSTMDLDQRAVFVLFELEGYTGPEIAETTGVPLATVYSRLRLARDGFERAARRHRARARRESQEAAQ